MNRAQGKWAIFLHSLILSASTIGGGYVILSVMRRLYVEKLGWLSEEEMLDVASLSQSAPGAVAVNASILLGYRFGGISGAAVSVLGTLLPPLGIMSLISALYVRFRRIELIGKLLLGMQAGVSAVILGAALGMTKAVLQPNSPVRVLLFAGALTASVFLGIRSAYVILLAALIGLLFGFRKHRRGSCKGERNERAG